MDNPTHRAIDAPHTRYVGDWEQYQEFSADPTAHVDAQQVKATPPLPPLVARQRYTLRREVGRGGMGVVWEAYDLELSRRCALKLLHVDLATDVASVEQLRNEVRLARLISHPHVVRVFDLVDVPGGKAICMEYVEGETLRDKVQEETSLPVDIAVLLAKQICAALDHAHDLGIVHCDLKPQNILIDLKGDARIGDFGLALGLHETALPRPAKAGTPAYMAPEVRAGNSPTVRSDIYSFGVVLYEILTGHLPECAPNCPTATKAVPHWLLDIANRCLSELPKDRYRSFGELLADLRREGHCDVKRHSRVGRKRMMIVLLCAVIIAGCVAAFCIHLLASRQHPVTDRSHAHYAVAIPPFHGCASNGTAHAIRTVLVSRLTNITAIRLVTAQPTDNKIAVSSGNAPLFVIKGTLDCTGGGITLTVDITDSASGRLRGRVTTKGKATHLAELQDRALPSVLALLPLPHPALARTARGLTRNTAALEKYIVGQQLLGSDSDDVVTAARMFSEAIALDPSFALAHAALASTRYTLFRKTGQELLLTTARTAAEHAYDLDNELAEVIDIVALLYVHSKQADRAVSIIKHALSRTVSSGLYWRLGVTYTSLNLHEEATSAYGNAIALDPFNWRLYGSLGVSYLNTARYCQALDALEEAQRLNPHNTETRNNIGSVYLWLGKYKQSIPYLEAALQQEPSAASYSNLGTAHLLSGHTQVAVALFERARSMSPNEAVYVGNLADAYRWANEMEKAHRLYRIAISMSEAALKRDPENYKTMARLALYYARSKEFSRAQTLLAAARTGRLNDRELTYRQAIVYVLWQKNSLAVEMIDRAYQQGVASGYIVNDPDLAPLHNSERFKVITYGARTGGCE